MKNITQKSLLLLIAISLILITATLIILQLLSFEKREKKLSQQQILQEAKAHFNGMVNTRSWNAQYGGVYVKAKNGLQPNPYLKNNILYTDKNETLIKINPAWMTRQISEISNKKGSYHYKITSLKPINPSNKADIFETKALNYFEQHKTSKYFYEFDTKDKAFNFMGVLITQESCLKCHAFQGYQLGDIRGGIRVSVPISMYLQQNLLLEEKTEHSITIVVIVSFLLMLLVALFTNIFYKRQYEIENAKEILEQKVTERTHDLKLVVSREQHLKDILKIITELNELLISSYSTKSVLKNATQKLDSNRAYVFTLSALISENILEIISQSQPNKSLIKSSLLSLEKDENSNFLVKAIRKAIELKHPITEKISHDTFEYNRRESDINLEWMIVLPLLNGYESDAYGVITVFTSNANGFEIEEMKILENMAHDISIALYSHKQKDAILAMEKEKNANYEETILAFVNIIEQRDTYTAGHTIRVAQYCTLIAKEIGIKKSDVKLLEKAAILHDIGKVATPDTILLKPSKLSRLEYELIKQHSEVGADMLERISIYKNLAEIIRYHHARYDGKGYPRTASPNNIPFLSHIMILADSFDAMTSNRIYRPRKSVPQALSEIQAESGTQFHPDVVKAALVALKDVNISQTSQIPLSELEKKRMAYFFKDSLTGLYNEDYLKTILNRQNHKYTCINIINLNNFSSFNHTQGWGKGDELLKKFASFLVSEFPQTTIIRYHGDDFIILCKNHLEINQDVIKTSQLIQESGVTVSITHYDTHKGYFDFTAFQEMEGS